MVLDQQLRKRIIQRRRNGETYKQIAEREHVSFRDIGKTLKEDAQAQDGQQPVVSEVASFPKEATKVAAFKLFKRHVPLEDVFIKLGMEDVELLKKWYLEYLDLKGLGRLKSLYETVGGPRIISVADSILEAEKEGFTPDDMITGLKDRRAFPTISKEVQALRAEKDSLLPVIEEYRQLEARIPAMRKELEELKKKHLQYRKHVLPDWMTRQLFDALDSKQVEAVEIKIPGRRSMRREVKLDIGCRYGERALVDTMTALSKLPDSGKELIDSFKPHGTFTRLDLNFQSIHMGTAMIVVDDINKIEAERIDKLAMAPAPPQIASS